MRLEPNAQSRLVELTKSVTCVLVASQVWIKVWLEPRSKSMICWPVDEPNDGNDVSWVPILASHGRLFFAVAFKTSSVTLFFANAFKTSSVTGP